MIICLENLISLSVQGKILRLALAESTDFTWKSFLCDIKKGTHKFLSKTVIDILPAAAANLENCARGARPQHIVSTSANWPWIPANGGTTTLCKLLQNSASPSPRGRLLYIHPVVGRRRHVLLPLILPQ